MGIKFRGRIFTISKFIPVLEARSFSGSRQMVFVEQTLEFLGPAGVYLTVIMASACILLIAQCGCCGGKERWKWSERESLGLSEKRKKQAKKGKKTY
jgi:hypothetical protein